MSLMGESSGPRSPGLPAPGLLPESWRVHLPIFDGPLDLLLHLVKINEVKIADIPVARVCDQFHEYLMLMENLNLDVAGEYIYEAALLIHLKSKLLLPRRESESDEGAPDPRQELVDRLLEYQRIKEAAQSLAEVDRMRLGIWTRTPADVAPALEDQELDLSEVSLFDLLGAFRQALSRYDREHPPAMVLAAEVFTVRQQLDRLLAALDAGAGRPYDLLADLRTLSCRAEAVAAFLAVLELARLSLVRLHQAAAGEIVLYRTTRRLSDEELETIQG